MDYSNISNKREILIDISDKATCRICLEDDTLDNLIYPCKCSGNSKYVHKKCLNEWRTYTTNQEYLNKCEICDHTYAINSKEYVDGWFTKIIFTNWKMYILINLISYITAAIAQSYDDSNRLIGLFISNPDSISEDTAALIYFLISLGFYTIILLLYILIGTLTLKNKKLYCRLYSNYKITMTTLILIGLVGVIYNYIWIIAFSTEYFICLIGVIHIQSINKVNKYNRSKIENYEPEIENCKSDMTNNSSLEYANL